MSRWRSTVEALFGVFWYIAVVVLVPLAALLVSGLLYLAERDALLPALGGWLALTLLAYAVFYGRRYLGRPGSPRHAEHASEDAAAAVGESELPERLEPRRDWSDRDREIWDRCCRQIEAFLAPEPGWSELQDQAVALLAEIAGHYHAANEHAAWRFTLPEALLITEEASRRYRAVVTAHLPWADRITVASVLSMYQQQDRIKRGWTWFNRSRRVLRLWNPLGAVIGEVRDLVTDRVLTRVSSTMQTAFKRLLLQEIAQVGIDLYSGRLRVGDAEVATYRSRAAREDEARRAEPLEPLRVVLAGQVSAGKSSLVNALAESVAAETDLLPTTDRTTVHQLHIDDELRVHLVDTRGLEGSDDSIDYLAGIALEADLLLWLCRATQPAREPDRRLLERLRERLAREPRRRAPPMVLVLSHVDLLAPRSEWAPPYDLDRAEGKAARIRQALESVREQIGFDAATPAVPVCLAAERGRYNVEAITAQLLALAESAAQTQLNRRRLELREQSVDWSERWRQVRNLGLVLGRSVIRQNREGP